MVTEASHQIQNRNFHHALVEVRSAILHDLYCNNLLGFQVLAFYYLSKSTLPKNIKDEIAISGGTVS